MGYYLLILESIGTPELFLIAMVALIIFGPRKLPQIGRTIGKYTAEFKKASQEFKETWENEVKMADFEENTGTRETNLAKLEELVQNQQNGVENTIGRNNTRKASEISDLESLNENHSVALPEVRAIDPTEYHAYPVFGSESRPLEDENAEAIETVSEPAIPQRKRDWL